MRRVTLRVRHADNTYSLEDTGCWWCRRGIPWANVLSLCRGRVWLTLAIMCAATLLSMATLLFACYAVVSESVRHRNSGIKNTLLGIQYSGRNVLDLQQPSSSSSKHRSLKSMDNRQATNTGYVNALVRDGISRNSIAIKTRVDHYDGFTLGDKRNTVNILLNLNSSVSKLLVRTNLESDTNSKHRVHSEQTGVNVPSSSSFHDSRTLNLADSTSSSNKTNSTKYAILDAESKALRKLPQAIIIGVKKGGTRALLEFIRLHPDVRAPGPETHFFDRCYHKGFEWYRRKMPPTIVGQITIEKTPSYFVTKEVPRRIYDMSKDVKLIVVVRDPVTRAISDYTQAHTKRPETKPFEQMAFLENTTGVVDTSWGAIRIGVYAKHLERWLKYFPLKQMHFVNGEKLITDPAGEMAKVQSFLGLKCIVTEKHFYFHESKGFPCLKKHEGSGKPHCLGKTKGRTHPHIETKAVRSLRDFYRPFNVKFSQMVGQDFGWPD